MTERAAEFSRREASLTALPITVKSSLPRAPIFRRRPRRDAARHRRRCQDLHHSSADHSAPCWLLEYSLRRPVRPCRPLRIFSIGRKDRQHAIAHELEDLARIFLDMPADQLEMFIQKPGYFARLINLGQRREVSQVRKQDRSIDRPSLSPLNIACKDACTCLGACIDGKDIRCGFRCRNTITSQPQRWESFATIAN